MKCSFCKNEINDEKFFTSRDTQDCFIHNDCLMDKLPHPAFLHHPKGKKWDEQQLDNLIEIIITAQLKHQSAQSL